MKNLLDRESRFNMNARTFQEAVEYYQNRAIQLLKEEIFISSITDMGEYALAIFYNDKEEFVSYYVYEQHRGKGIYKSLIPKLVNRVLIGDECHLRNFLVKHKADYRQVKMTPLVEYEMIANHYGYDKAKRSGVPLMNHIDEGLAILQFKFHNKLGAGRPYCLHPILQSDKALSETYDEMSHKSWWDVSPSSIIVAMEYRNIANQYLSMRKISSIDEIKLSPLIEVNEMLVADKIQNYKDFELYHKDTHPRSAELDEYFKNWLQRLDISMEQYQFLKNKITVKPTIYG